MDLVALIITALGAGAALGLKGTASAALKDVCAALKALAAKRLASRADGALMVKRHAENAETWEGPTAAELTAAEADRDHDLVGAARILMGPTDEAGLRSGKYSVDVLGSQGVPVREGNFLHNTFGPRRGAENRRP